MKAHQNPFSIQNLQQLEFLFNKEDDLQSVTDRFLVQTNDQPISVLLGKHGTGKSTLLRKIGSLLQQRDYQVFFLTAAKHKSHTADPTEQTPKNGRDLKSPSPLEHFPISTIPNQKHSVVLLDCGESIGWWSWFRIRWLLPTARILMTVHKNHHFNVLYHCQSTADDLAILCNELLKHQPPSVQSWFQSNYPPGEIEQLWKLKGGDVRQCLFHLYDQFSQLALPQQEKGQGN